MNYFTFMWSPVVFVIVIIETSLFLWYTFIGRHDLAQKTDFDEGKIYFWVRVVSPNEPALVALGFWAPPSSRPQ